MRLAFVEEVRTDPAPNLQGKCCLCGDDMIAKCVQYVRWHWAHKAKITCDPWRESETDWRRYWKDAFPANCQEVVHVDDRTLDRTVDRLYRRSGVFSRLGLTDAVLLESISADRPLITVDFNLYGAALAKGDKFAYNFTHWQT